MLKVSVNYRGLVAAHAAIRARLPAERTEFLHVVVRKVIHELNRYSPRDTNRYLRAWILAGKMLNVGDVPLPPIRESKYKREYIQQLVDQISRMDAEVARADRLMFVWYENQNRKRRGYYNVLVARRHRAEQRLDRARDELQKFIARTDSIVVGVGVNVLHGKVTGSFVRGGGRKLSVTVRDKVYGGMGMIRHGPEGSYLVLSNREPHAQIVEWRHGTLRRATAGARLAGLRPIAAAMTRRLAAVADAASPSAV